MEYGVEECNSHNRESGRSNSVVVVTGAFFVIVLKFFNPIPNSIRELTATELRWMDGRTDGRTQKSQSQVRSQCRRGIAILVHLGDLFQQEVDEQVLPRFSAICLVSQGTSGVRICQKLHKTHARSLESIQTSGSVCLTWV
jgi:hypothetical protein